MSIKHLDADEEHQLVLRGQAGDTDARNAVVMSLYGFIYSQAVAMVRFNHTIDAAELAQEGVSKVLRTFKTFKPDRSRAITYFGKVASRAMRLFLLRKNRVVVLPFTKSKSKRCDQFEQAVDHMLSLDYDCNAQSEHSSDMPQAFRDIVLFDRMPFVDDAVCRREMASALERVMERLRRTNWRQWRTLSMWSNGSKLSEIGEELGVVRERARQIKEDGLRSLHKLIRSELQR